MKYRRSINIHTIKGVDYHLYSLEKASEGGRISKADAIQQLKAAGIKVTTTGAYTPYVGHYALMVECDRARDADKILFGE